MAHKCIKQHDVTDCGAACIASVAAHYKLYLPIARIRQYAGTDKKGTNVLGLLEALGRLGFTAKGVRANAASLTAIPLPAIAHVVLNNDRHHYVVLYAVSGKSVRLMDPAQGKLIRKPFERFQAEWSGILVLMEPDTGFTAANKKVSVVRRFYQLLRPHNTVIAQAFFGAVVYTLLGFSTAIYIQKITDFVLGGNNLKLMNLLGVLMLLCIILQLVVGIFKDIFLTKTGQQIDMRLILGYYKHLLHLPQSFFDTMRVGEIISRVNDAVKIRHFINGVALNLSVNCLILLFSFLFMFSYYWKLALVMMLVIPVFCLLYFLVNRLNRNTERKVMEHAADLESQLVESLSAVGTIKRFGLQRSSNAKTEFLFVKLLQSTYQSAMNRIFSGSSSGFVSQVYVVLLFWCGSYFVVGQEITAGELMSFYAIIGYLTGPLLGLINSNKDIQNAFIAADRLFEIMDLEIEDQSGSLSLDKKDFGQIEFRNVSFRYGNRALIVKNIDLRINKGEVIAFAGISGSGKSTLAALMQRIYPVNKGSIRINDFDISQIKASCLHSFIASVPQNIHLFNSTVIDNIALGDPNPRIEDIIKICRQLGISDFIEKLPYAYNTVLGENGATLSGGQRQRLAIARAIYREPAILILDEATSSLDSRAAQFVNSTIKNLKKQGMTVVIIAHRLRTIINADRIVVLDKGRIIETGDHLSLLGKKGAYYQLFRDQYFHINSQGDTVFPNANNRARILPGI
ncbi:peptidase domain-containing ABC transporter [Zeaxanthinibacter enoshimensis]|uniref:ATP-binding cassette subfamily B protein n=1 Tax=Zeaxanthinibacter enoshimensis TaxID=392009 RepID=A0A4R6TNG5_9FLAO|nr:peptidase domain-containing ABC transporter [Zeaxanthinibacter enoshimensis]TDQ31458.1 ATP-binding cassette subfamily B protein [Zeaxanthinibacter enoshimensis]